MHGIYEIAEYRDLLTPSPTVSRGARANFKVEDSGDSSTYVPSLLGAVLSSKVASMQSPE